MRGDNGNGDWESFTIRLVYLFNLFSNLKSVGSVIHWSCVTEGMLKLKINLVVNKSKVLA